jgi:hypothetical protein
VALGRVTRKDRQVAGNSHQQMLRLWRPEIALTVKSSDSMFEQAMIHIDVVAVMSCMVHSNLYNSAGKRRAALTSSVLPQ